MRRIGRKTKISPGCVDVSTFFGANASVNKGFSLVSVSNMVRLEGIPFQGRKDESDSLNGSQHFFKKLVQRQTRSGLSFVFYYFSFYFFFRGTSLERECACKF